MIIACIIVLSVVIVGFSYYSYRICFYSPNNRKEDILNHPKGKQYEDVALKMVEIALIMNESPCQWVSIIARDGTSLQGRLYEYFPDAPILLAFHGYRSMALRDCVGAFALGQKLGFNVLAVDQRSHGKSEGNVITFGVRERYDCIDWIHFCRTRFGEEHPIVLSGISMGAATVLMASELPLPENVVCIMADCPYSSPAEIIQLEAARKGYPKTLCYPIIRFGAKIFGKLDIEECTAQDAVQKAKIPILLIHGEDDRFVPCQMSRTIYENCHNYAEFYTFPSAGHGLSYLIDPRRYEKICVAFLWKQKKLHPWLERSEFVCNTISE